MNRNIFADAVKRVSIFSNKASRQIALELDGNQVTITTEDPENITTGKETLECDYDGDPMTIPATKGPKSTIITCKKN